MSWQELLLKGISEPVKRQYVKGFPVGYRDGFKDGERDKADNTRRTFKGKPIPVVTFGSGNALEAGYNMGYNSGYPQGYAKARGT